MSASSKDEKRKLQRLHHLLRPKVMPSLLDVSHVERSMSELERPEALVGSSPPKDRVLSSQSANVPRIIPSVQQLDLGGAQEERKFVDALVLGSAAERNAFDSLSAHGHPPLSLLSSHPRAFLTLKSTMRA